ncbi:nucleoside 2-deoxyribosyltransferase [Staphylococcus pettenkoferi]|uniref:Nucleoside 2-deoxyribosyltransferase n=1 Tax=Staphylococcus pettenkoferi TaxID=170573 RepID=A0A9Q4D8W4_9STAP|nr:nucleoside 2-deoxyribosyltransferase [Staphylococcus pettenkoferi]MCY1595440.1 nucleoside 2-deoxyribosyltransferase [Staphylococcus pettenkoferi]
MSKRIYLGGDMLSLGQQMRREWEKKELERLGFDVYAPQDDKDINDKQNANQTGLAERIVYNDTAGIYKSDILIFDYLPHAQGTIAEMGYVHGLLQYVDNDKYDIYVQCTDVRQGTGHISNEQDRTEFSINQYVYGVILELTEGRGIQTFEEICQELINNEF